MATQQDLQELLRLLTVGRKTPMMQAMTQIKALQAADLRSIRQIAEAPLEKVQSALKDDKAAKLLQNACKATLKRAAATPAAGDKRGAPGLTTPQAKRTKTELFKNGPTEMTPQELERSLELPLCMDEERIAKTVIQTNRAPLVLAFAVELLRHTMPEQPLSSRLSLGQAVVSANSRSKAVSLGLSKGPSADEEGWGEGQPRVKVMGREIAVLKRGGYEWRGEETVGEPEGGPKGEDEATKAGSSVSETQISETQISETQISETQAETQTQTSSTTATATQPATQPAWSTSPPVTLKDSTFIARARPITNPSQRASLIQSLLTTHPNLQTATHNAWAYRLKPPSSDAHPLARVREASFDDGETGCGDLMLRVMRDAGAVDTLVVLTRWFGGTMLGPDRWRLMRNCVSGALAERLRRTGVESSVGGEAVWGLDLEGERARVAGGGGNGRHESGMGGIGGMRVHAPAQARNYLLRSFGSAPEESTAATSTMTTGKSPKKAKPLKVVEAEKEENLGLLLGALRIVFDSWADHLGAAELDRRAWSWYVAVRPEVESGQAGWGAKGLVQLSDVLKLKRPAHK